MNVDEEYEYNSIYIESERKILTKEIYQYLNLDL